MITEQEVLKLVAETELSENILRKKEAYKSFQCYEGNLRYYVLDRLKEMYPQTFSMFQISDYSVLKKIVDKKSKAYKENPVRKLDSEEETKLYQSIIESYSLNEAMKKIDKYYNQHKYCLLSVFFERSKDYFGKVNDNFKFIPLAPYEFDVKFTEMGVLECVILSYPDQQVVTGSPSDGYNSQIAGNIQDMGADKKVYAVWTQTNHWIVQGQKRANGEWNHNLIFNEGNPSNINPYGVIPFVYLPMDFISDYPVSSPLQYQTVELNAEMSTYYTSGSMQIGTLVLKYPTSQAIESVVQGLFTGMKLPQSENPDAPETTADYIAPSPNMSGHREAILTHISAILDEQGINSNQLINPNESFTSGFDRLLASADVQDIIEDNQGFYRKVEQGVYHIIQSIYKNFIKRDVFKSEKLNVYYKKPKILVSDTDKLNNIEKMDSLGLILPWEKFMLMDPNLSEDDAKQRIDEMNRIKNESIMSLTGGSGNSFNGAQVTAIAEIVTKAAAKALPRESAVNLLVASFGMTLEIAEKIIPPINYVPEVYVDSAGRIIENTNKGNEQNKNNNIKETESENEIEDEEETED